VVFGEEFGEAKIENLDGASLGDENVGGLDIAVDDAFCGRRRGRPASWMRCRWCAEPEGNPGGSICRESALRAIPWR